MQPEIIPQFPEEEDNLLRDTKGCRLGCLVWIASCIIIAIIVYLVTTL